MITLHRSGQYKLIETKSDTKVLYLDNDIYAWVEPAHMGEILVFSHKVHKTDYLLSMGMFKLYDVEDESALSDQMHLELEVGESQWQGYLLLSGLPDDNHRRVRIIPTNEIITTNPQYEQGDKS